MADASGLQVRGLVRHFGGVQAVRGIRLSVQPGECVALIGPNGAGKSTSFACISGQLAPSAGEVWWNGQPVHGLPPAQRLRLGLARTFQVAQTFEALSVLHNVQLVLPDAAVRSPWESLDAWRRPEALALLERVGLANMAALPARVLPYGAKKRLELAMALAGLLPSADAPVAPGLLLLDEPAAGLAPSERADLMRLVLGLTRQGEAGRSLAVLYTEHNMDAVFGVADRVLVLMQGQLMASGTAEQVAQDPRVRADYLGLGFQAERSTHAET